MSGFDIRYVFYFSTPQTSETLDTIQSELHKHFSIQPTVMTQHYVMLNIISQEQLQALRIDTEALKSLVRRVNAIQGIQTQPLPLTERESKLIRGRSTLNQDHIIDYASQTIVTRAPIKLQAWAAIKK
jgi:hypothetical protein